MKFGSWRRMPGPPNVTTVCGTSSGMKARCGGLAACDVGDRRQAGLGRQSAEGLVQQFAERVGIDIADHRDPQRVLGDHAADIVLQVGDVDLRHAVQRAVGLPAIGMIAEGDFEELAAGQRGRVGGVAPQAGDHLRANALDIGGVEMRRGQRQSAAGRRPRPCCPSACAASRGNNPALDEKLSSMARRSRRSWKVLESRSPEPSSSRLGDHVADAGLVGRVLARRRRRRHIPSRSAARWRPARTRPRCRRAKPGAGSLPRRATASMPARSARRRRRASDPKRGAPVWKTGHERFSSRFGAAVSLIR